MGKTEAGTGSETLKATQIRDAATIIVVRDGKTRPQVLMGQRGASAAFMPNKFVFPGGAVDPVDRTVALAAPPDATCVTRLQQDCDATLAPGLVAAAIRELWEETGLILGAPGPWTDSPPQGWRGFAAAGYRPCGAGLHFIFRAITPPGRPRRFDARFFLAMADSITNDLDDFSGAEDELAHLQWIPLDEVRGFNLPFITEVVLAEIGGLLEGGLPPASVPFFRNCSERSEFLRLR
ncbi:8-oxo-dGTP pyrophosphatase MutT (NUDIX family) [Rhodovulum imhoffii]|uniref:8-oxo-dGTP pyrophosphatase MutT (NUDIX family) n=1 Tax=Rhodovulum imhoffii TaxID=365340 RepID=A0A2T5BQZ3_9RHOB|nr:NUDIX hydrolase [Rhodovulum imhoffii]MBK5932579.1 DNA mismatch repair protein MutT [Rhodovulum imhoffii]PTN01638.1 8-oxo-dGTP pyrophosphatase MutT (NUDIX family) [Rhodovulum imhoffii]